MTTDDFLSHVIVAIDELHRLREEAESNRLFMQNVAVRLAVNQLRGNRVDYEDCDPEQWDKLAALAADGRLALSRTGEVFIELKKLTHETLRSAPLVRQGSETRQEKAT